MPDCRDRCQRVHPHPVLRMTRSIAPADHWNWTVDHRPFTDHLQRQANDPGMSKAELVLLAKVVQQEADWLQSQAAEAQRLAARLRRKVRGRA